jgi:hypothetical protein
LVPHGSCRRSRLRLAGRASARAAPAAKQATKRKDTLRLKAGFQTFPEPRIGSGNVPTNLSKLSAFEVAQELIKRSFVEILKNFAQLFLVGAMWRKAANAD